MVKGMKLGTKIAAGYTLVGALFVAVLFVSALKVSQTAEANRRLVELRAPTARAGLSLMNGVNRSLASLRGWIILPNEEFKTMRQDAWSGEIDPALEQLQALSARADDGVQTERLGQLAKDLKELARHQEEIERIAQTVDNVPAFKVLADQATPKSEDMHRHISAMIDAEAKLGATAERKVFLGIMADVRGTGGNAVGNLRAFLFSGDPQFRTKFEGVWAKNERRFEDLRLQESLMTPAQLRAFESYAEARSDFAALVGQMIELRASPEWNRANAWLGAKAAPVARRIQGTLDEMIVQQQRAMDVDGEAARASAATTQVFMWTALGIAVFLCIALGWGITRSVTRPLHRLIRGMRDGADHVSSGAFQVSDASQSIAQGASEQASALAEVSSTIDNMSARTRDNAAHAKEASDVAVSAARTAEHSRGAIERMGEAMLRIKQSSDQTAKIVQAIDDIAFQTNLLALNASVEAARAGEAGKGFSVVADEVRNLAERSAEAVRSTSLLIEEAQTNAQAGVSASSDVEARLTELAEQIGRVSKLMVSISTASQDQASGATQISAGISQLDQVTQANASGAEQTAAAARSLSEQSDRMNRMVASLVDMIGGGSDDDDHLATAPAIVNRPLNVRSRSEAGTTSRVPPVTVSERDVRAAEAFFDGGSDVADEDVLARF